MRRLLRNLPWILVFWSALFLSAQLFAQRAHFRNHKLSPPLNLPDHHNPPPSRSHLHRRHK